MNDTIFNRPWFQRSLLLIILLIATWLRLWRLADIPPGLEYDEAFKGLDALWLLKTHILTFFFLGNHGREPMFMYAAALFITLLGTSPFALRLTSAIAGVLAVALIYRLVMGLFRHDEHRRWLALVAAAGLGTSFWHLSMSRVALRVVLIPPFFTLLAYLFWRGWQIQAKTRDLGFWKNWLAYRYFVSAGLVLGLSQYTYLSARLFPLLLLLFALVVTGISWLIIAFQIMFSTRSNDFSRYSGLKRLKSLLQAQNGFLNIYGKMTQGAGGRPELSLPALWSGLFVTGIVGLIIFTPMAMVFLQNPAAFTERASNVELSVQWTAEGMITLGQHLAQAVSLFTGGSDPRIRHHLVGEPVFDWLVLAGFWSGVGVAVKEWYRPPYLFLLLSLLVMWLPGPLSVDPIHLPRTSGILPAFYILMAIGLFRLGLWGINKLPLRFQPAQVGWLSLGLVLLGSGSVNTFAYFGRWANHPLVYREYKNHRTELTQYALDLSRTTDVIVPYSFYSYPYVRYLLYDTFREELMPASPPVGRRPAVYLTPDPPLERSSPLHVWLSYDETGQGVAYLIHSWPEQWPAPQQAILDSRNNRIANRFAVGPELMSEISAKGFTTPLPFSWGGHAHLAGYGLWPAVIPAGRPGLLVLCWQGLLEADLDYNLFIQILDDQGRVVSETGGKIVAETRHYYENRLGFVYQPYLFWSEPDWPSGLYLLRLGLFNPRTGERLPITRTAGTTEVITTMVGTTEVVTTTAGTTEVVTTMVGTTEVVTTNSNEFVGDQLVLTPFYVLADGIDPRVPAKPLRARLGENIELLGYSMDLSASNPAALEVKLYWQAINSIADDYTAFIHLLDGQDQIISQWDSPPLAGLYPTSRWFPGQVVVSRFTLPLPKEGSMADYRLVTGMYNSASGLRVPVFDMNGQPKPDNLIVLNP